MHKYKALLYSLSTEHKVLHSKQNILGLPGEWKRKDQAQKSELFCFSEELQIWSPDGPNCFFSHRVVVNGVDVS